MTLLETGLEKESKIEIKKPFKYQSFPKIRIQFVFFISATVLHTR